MTFTTTGYDEAGVGEVYGAMYGVAVALTARGQQCLRQLNLPDPKRLTIARMMAVYQLVKREAVIRVVRVSPRIIDRTNMNVVKLNASRQALAAVIRRTGPLPAVIDCPWSDKSAFSRAFLKTLPLPDCTITHRADSTFEAVKFASVVARLRYRRQYAQFAHHGTIGSGNLADAETKRFCKAHPDLWFIRKKWRIP